MLRTLIAGILIVTMSSCTTWKAVSISPERYIKLHDPEVVWVQLQDGSALILGRPRVFLDTLRGVNAGGYRNIPLSNVVRLRAQEPAKAKTALLITALALLTVGTIYLGAHSDRIQQ